MKLLHVLVLLVTAEAIVYTDAVPGQCIACATSHSLTRCSSSAQRNYSCLSDRGSLGTTHCGSAAVKYRDEFSSMIFTDVYRGCFNCTDKKSACFSLGGYLRNGPFGGRTLLECDIECCKSSLCNTQNSTLTKDAVTVFQQNGSGPLQCKACFARDERQCILGQSAQDCGGGFPSLGTTHCGYAKIKYSFILGGGGDWVYRGCINCADKKSACAMIGGHILGRMGWKMLECDIQCCNSSNCNDVAADLPTCTHCEGICSDKDPHQACSLNPAFGSLGTTHCGSVVGRYLDGSGNVKDLAYRGCFDCANKKAACFALGGYLKRARSWTLLDCEINCCTGNNCNTQIPTGAPSANAITVFAPSASGPKQCYECVGNNQFTNCSRPEHLRSQSCATGLSSLGTTHCGSVVGKYQDGNGNIVDGSFRGCIDCADKNAACAAVGGFFKGDRRRLTQLECAVICCTGDDCNKVIMPVLKAESSPSPSQSSVAGGLFPTAKGSEAGGPSQSSDAGGPSPSSAARKEGHLNSRAWLFSSTTLFIFSQVKPW